MSVRFCSFGDLGSGKTLCLVKKALRYHRQFPDRPVYSSIELRELWDRYRRDGAWRSQIL